MAPLACIGASYLSLYCHYMRIACELSSGVLYVVEYYCRTEHGAGGGSFVNVYFYVELPLLYILPHFQCNFNCFLLRIFKNVTN
jgi:hypothetical protein